jgi:hypothetical protein
MDIVDALIHLSQYHQCAPQLHAQLVKLNNGIAHARYANQNHQLNPSHPLNAHILLMPKRDIALNLFHNQTVIIHHVSTIHQLQECKHHAQHLNALQLKSRLNWKLTDIAVALIHLNQ